MGHVPGECPYEHMHADFLQKYVLPHARCPRASFVASCPHLYARLYAHRYGSVFVCKNGQFLPKSAARDTTDPIVVDTLVYYNNRMGYTGELLEPGADGYHGGLCPLPKPPGNLTFRHLCVPWRCDPGTGNHRMTHRLFPGRRTCGNCCCRRPGVAAHKAWRSTSIPECRNSPTVVVKTIYVTQRVQIRRMTAR